MSHGYKVTFETELDEKYSSDKEGVGTVRVEGDCEYVWCAGVEGAIKGSVCVFFSDDYQLALLTHAVSPGARVGVPACECTGSTYGWAQICGPAKQGIWASRTAAPATILHSTATSGQVDDATIGLGICGLWLEEVATESEATHAGWMMYPNTTTGNIAA